MKLVLEINEEVLRAYNSTVSDRSTYLGFRIHNKIMCIYSEIHERLYLSMCNVSIEDDVNIRLPVEVMNTMMYIGTLLIETIESKGLRQERLVSYDASGNERCSALIASEYAENSTQIAEMLECIFKGEYIELPSGRLFDKAYKLANIKNSEVGIKGVNINEGKIFTLGNGFACYANTLINVSLVIPNTTLRALVGFTRFKNSLRLFRYKGYNLIFDGQNALAWRRARADKFYEIPETEYLITVDMKTDILITLFKSIKTEVSECKFCFKKSALEIYSQVGLYSIPLQFESMDLPDMFINYKLLSEVISNCDHVITMFFGNNILYIKSGDVNYFIGARQ